jgi:hypothetical protein
VQNPPVFQDADVNDLVQGRLRDLPDVSDPSPRPKVRVAIIDTWPMTDTNHPLDDIRAFFDSHGQPPHLEPFARPNAAVPPPVVPENHIRDCVTDLTEMESLRTACRGEEEDPFDVRDHGLFIAGLIHQIAPAAEIYVYRAFNHFGVGTHEAITHAVNRAIADAEVAGDRLVINCSFGLAPELFLVPAILWVDNPPANPDVPRLPDDGLQPHSGALDAYRHIGPWLQNASNEVTKRSQVVMENPPGGGPPRRLVRRTPQAQRLDQEVRSDPTLQAVQTLFRLAGRPNVLAVAAAGNDSCRVHGQAGGPRIPAVVEGVLGVSAIVPAAGNTWEAATYSNDDDLSDGINVATIRDDAVSAFGGDSTEKRGWGGDPPNDPGGKPRPGESRGGLIGPYVAPAIMPRPGRGLTQPIDPVPNQLGLAEWSGTSFATPVAAGVAARLWLARPGASAQQILTAIRGDATTAVNEVQIDDVGDPLRRIELLQR